MTLCGFLSLAFFSILFSSSFCTPQNPILKRVSNVIPANPVPLELSIIPNTVHPGSGRSLSHWASVMFQSAAS